MLARRLLSSATRSSLRGIPSPSLHRQACRPFSMIVHDSPHPSVDIPNKTIWEIVGDQLSVHRHKAAFIDGITHEKVTFGEIYERARNFAVALAKDGVKKGDVVILHSFNCLDYPMAILALTSLGAVCSPASHLFLPDELAVQIKAAKANFIITHKELEATVVEAAKMCGITRGSIYTMGHAPDASQDLKSVDEVIQSSSDYSFEFEKIDPTTNVLLPFSSGTTGTPKGVALSAKNILANALQVDHVENLHGYSLGLVPFFHIYGIKMMHLSMYQGAAKVILPRFDHDTFLRTLSTYKIRTAHFAPAISLLLATTA